MLRRIAAIVLSISLLGTHAAFAAPQPFDDFILTDPIAGTYTGRPQAEAIIGQLRFTDMPATPAARDAIVRAGAMGAIVGGDGVFRPAAAATRAEALAVAVRAAGYGDYARYLGETLWQSTELINTNLYTAWLLGYMLQASNMGLITMYEYNYVLLPFIPVPPAPEPEVIPEPEPELPFLINGAALPGFEPEPPTPEPVPEPEPLLPSTPFAHNQPATREEVAAWFVGAMEYANSNIFTASPTAAGRMLPTFTDRGSITPARAAAVETAVRHNIMAGNTATTFNPGGTVSRQLLANIVRNLDSFLHEIHGLQRRTGVVGGIVEEFYTETGAGYRWRHIHVRRADGGVDVLRHETRGGASPQYGTLDAVVLRGTAVAGLMSLQEGDQIEYIIQPATGTVWYVWATNFVQTQVVRLALQVIDFDSLSMTFRNEAGHIMTFPMAAGVAAWENGTEMIRLGNWLYPAAEFPRGSMYDVTLTGNIITRIDFVGEPEMYREIRGLVIDNDADFGSLTILDENRRERSFTFIPGAVVAQRRSFYDFRDRTPRYVHISQIIPGDIVVLSTCEDDPTRITEISAAENVHSMYGQIREIRDQGSFFDMLFQFEDGSTSWFTIAGNGPLITSHGRPIRANALQIGDWARILVNRAVLAPGVLMETIREIAVDTGGHHISAVVLGRISGIHTAQNTIQVQNARTMNQAGWGNYYPLSTFTTTANTRYYLDGRSVSAAHISRYVNRSDASVYLALDTNFTGARVVKASFRTGREQHLPLQNVLSSTTNSFTLLGTAAPVTTDPGTIVVRNNRLVGSTHVFAPDWAQVVLSGGNNAAVINIQPAPATTGVQIIRGRIARVGMHDTFRVTDWGIRIFEGLTWAYAPIAREFSTSPDTIWIDGGGVTSMNNFLGFGDDTVVDRDFNIVVYGGRAIRIIDAPFTNPTSDIAGGYGHLTVRGIITAIDGDTIELRDMTVFNGRTGQWSIFDPISNHGSITSSPNTIIIDRNEVIGTNGLRVGMQIKALSAESREDATLAPGITVGAYIIQVER